MSDAASSKAPIARIADKVAGVFVTVVLIVAVIVFIIWMLLGSGIEISLTRAIAVMVVSCPCALGLATPVAIMVGSGVSARHGIPHEGLRNLLMAYRDADRFITAICAEGTDPARKRRAGQRV